MTECRAASGFGSDARPQSGGGPEQSQSGLRPRFSPGSFFPKASPDLTRDTNFPDEHFFVTSLFQVDKLSRGGADARRNIVHETVHAPGYTLLKVAFPKLRGQTGFRPVNRGLHLFYCE